MITASELRCSQSQSSAGPPSSDRSLSPVDGVALGSLRSARGAERQVLVPKLSRWRVKTDLSLALALERSDLAIRQLVGSVVTGVLQGYHL
jgi:hypothetical protein